MSPAAQVDVLVIAATSFVVRLVAALYQVRADGQIADRARKERQSLSARAAGELGRRSRAAGFRLLLDMADDGAHYGTHIVHDRRWHTAG